MNCDHTAEQHRNEIRTLMQRRFPALAAQIARAEDTLNAELALNSESGKKALTELADVAEELGKRLDNALAAARDIRDFARSAAAGTANETHWRQIARSASFLPTCVSSADSKTDDVLNAVHELEKKIDG